MIESVGKGGIFLSSEKTERKGLVLKIVLCVLVILLPSLLIGGVVFKLSHPREIIPDTITGVHILCGDESILLTEASDPATLKVLDQLINEGTPINASSLPALTDYTQIGLRIHTTGEAGERTTEYTLYVSPENPDLPERQAFFSVGTDTVKSRLPYYSAPAKPLRQFLKTDYLRACYSDAQFPVLTSSTGETIAPADGTWTYADLDGDTHTYSLPTVESLSVYEQTGSIRFSFSEEPSSCEIRIQNPAKELIFSGSEEELQHQLLSHTETLEVTVEARWNSDLGDRWGKYHFSLNYLAPAQFSIDTTHTVPGGFLVFRATNVRNTARLYFSSAPEIGTVPVYYPDPEDPENTVLGILPISSALPDYTYSIGFVYNGVSNTFRLPISTAGQSTRRLDITEKQVALAADPAVQAATEDLIRRVGSAEPGLFCLSGDIRTAGELLGLTPTYRFADTLQIGTETQKANSLFFATENGAAVPAVAGGTVAETGEDPLLGRYVVIDHGKNLRTWYTHLDTVHAGAGQAVVCGSVLGRAGTTGLSDTTGFGYFATIGQTVLDPVYLSEIVRIIQ